MKLQTRIYVTVQGCTDAKAARELVYEISVPLDELYDHKMISGYQAFVLKTEADYEEYDLDGCMLERETHDAFPAIFLNITCRIDQSPPNVEAI